MFSTVLVANRGEIACRIMRTAKAMGMTTVAVFSDADAKAKHVRVADRAVHLGGAPASESYLQIERILAAAQQTGAEAIHPGYGFLSENPQFAEAVLAAGFVWIGPTPQAIRAMGLKDESKRIAMIAGVPVLDGYQGADQGEKRLLKAAKEIGFPVLIKAVAGGGGRGIREVHSADDFRTQLESAQREARAAFGNDVVLIERLVQRPRHIEVQVFGDKHGNVVHMFERDCSMQRRRQKVIEEAPAPGMTSAVRAAMTEAAVKLAHAVSYENAGTVEFIVDGSGRLREDGFWFLEMNTRLQVEHPVTEKITGLDLVEWQFRVASGERLPLKQDEIHIEGHAIEARICAEDPGQNFRPSVGRLGVMALSESASVRHDVGFEEGDVVSPFYDSMIAKTIVHGPDRRTALDTLAQVMDDTCIDGPTVNTAFVAALARDPAMVSGDMDVGLIGRDLERLIADHQQHFAPIALVLAKAIAPAADQATAAWDVSDGFRLNRSATRSFGFDKDAKSRFFVVSPADRGVTVSDGATTWRIAAPAVQAEGRMLRVTGLIDGVALRAWIMLGASGWRVFVGGRRYDFTAYGSSAELHAGEGGDDVKAPLPGKIVAMAAAPGASVQRGDILLTLEAMKMEHALKAPRDGVVEQIATSVGDQVKEGAVLVRLAPVSS